MVYYTINLEGIDEDIQCMVEIMAEIDDNFEGDDEDYDYSLRYDDFIAPLVAYCQNLKKKNMALHLIGI